MGVRGVGGDESVTATSSVQTQMCLHLDVQCWPLTTHLKIWIIAFLVQISRK